MTVCVLFRIIMQSNQIQTNKNASKFYCKKLLRTPSIYYTRAKKHYNKFLLSIGEYQQIYHYVCNKSTIFFPSSISSKYPLYFLSLSLSNNYYNRLFFALRMNGLKDHSTSASSWSTVPNFSWYNRNSNLGPISFKCKDFGPFGMS